VKICRSDECLQNVLWQHIGIQSNVDLDIVIGYIDMLETEWKMRSRDGMDTPIRFAAKHLLFIVGCRDGLNCITVNIGGLSLHGGDLTLCLVTLLKLSHLLALYGGSSNLLTKNDIIYFTGSQGRDVDAVPLAEILELDKLKFRKSAILLTAKIRSFIATSTLIHSSSVSVGQMKCGSVMVDLSGCKIIFAFSFLTCKPRRRRIR